MNKPEIRQALRQAHEQLIEYVSSLSEADFTFAAGDKWSAGQQMEHICPSLKSLKQIMMLPPFLLRWLWGKPNRPGRSYEALVARYQQKLSEGGRATDRFIPKAVPFNKREALALGICSEQEKIGRRLDQFSEQELDTLLLPHPLLGKLSLREMMYFSIYHAGHHHKSMARGLKNRS
jgi:hypothetical protein